MVFHASLILSDINDVDARELRCNAGSLASEVGRLGGS